MKVTTVFCVAAVFGAAYVTIDDTVYVKCNVGPEMIFLHSIVHESWLGWPNKGG